MELFLLLPILILLLMISLMVWVLRRKEPFKWPFIIIMLVAICPVGVAMIIQKLKRSRIADEPVTPHGMGYTGSTYSKSGGAGLTISMYGDRSQGRKTQSNHEARKFCVTCNQADTPRCTRMIMRIAGMQGGTSGIENILKQYSLCNAGSPNDKSSSTCNKYNIGTSV